MSTRADSHIHLFREGFEDGGVVIDAGVTEYDELRREAGIDMALVVGYEGKSRYADNNVYVRDLAGKYPWIRSLAYLPAASMPSAGELAQLRADGHDGFALYLAEPGARVEEWDLAAEAFRGAIISVNGGPLQLLRFGAALAGLRDSVVLVSHLGLPGPVIDPEVALEHLAPLIALAAAPQVGVKVSGLYSIDPAYPFEGAAVAVDALLGAFGPERLVWGSDFSPALGFGTPAEVMAFPEWLGDRLSPSERAAVAGGTLKRLLRVGWS